MMFGVAEGNEILKPIKENPSLGCWSGRADRPWRTDGLHVALQRCSLALCSVGEGGVGGKKYDFISAGLSER